MFEYDVEFYGLDNYLSNAKNKAPPESMLAASLLSKICFVISSKKLEMHFSLVFLITKNTKYLFFIKM